MRCIYTNRHMYIYIYTIYVDIQIYLNHIHVYKRHEINIRRNYSSFADAVDVTSFGLCRFMNDLVALTGGFQDQCAAIVLGASQDCG